MHCRGQSVNWWRQLLQNSPVTMYNMKCAERPIPSDIKKHELYRKAVMRYMHKRSQAGCELLCMSKKRVTNVK